MIKSFLLALSFLTTIPIKIKGTIEPKDMGRSSVWFPFIGVAVGAILAGVYYLLNLIFPPILVAVLIVALWAGITGGLHLDGLADCCDGLFVATKRERRLEIMKDSRLGSFGAIGLILFLLVKIASIASLPQGNTAMPFILAACLGRWLILPVARTRSARPGGMADMFSFGLSPAVLLLGSFFPIVLSVLMGIPGICALGVAHLSTTLILLLARTSLGGITGDVLGMVVEVGELSVLLTFAAL